MVEVGRKWDLCGGIREEDGCTWEGVATSLQAGEHCSIHRRFFFLLCQEHSRQSPRPCPDLVGLVPLYVKVKIRLKLPRLGANLCSGFLLLFFSCFQDQVFSPGLPGAH